MAEVRREGDWWVGSNEGLWIFRRWTRERTMGRRAMEDQADATSSSMVRGALLPVSWTGSTTRRSATQRIASPRTVRRRSIRDEIETTTGETTLSKRRSDGVEIFSSRPWCIPSTTRREPLPRRLAPEARRLLPSRRIETNSISTKTNPRRTPPETMEGNPTAVISGRCHRGKGMRRETMPMGVTSSTPAAPCTKPKNRYRIRPRRTRLPPQILMVSTTPAPHGKDGRRKRTSRPKYAALVSSRNIRGGRPPLRKRSATSTSKRRTPTSPKSKRSIRRTSCCMERVWEVVPRVIWRKNCVMKVSWPRNDARSRRRKTRKGNERRHKNVGK
mmetsp:Transcript_22451/g.46178  ORF Transcript_22451/g.46178 Transcript_22451/m.46178 type:complete len:330 (+) Transcript_22451:400-1389(+)